MNDRRSSTPGILDRDRWQFGLPEIAEPITDRELIAKWARDPLRPNVPQKSCDVGLFSDDATQIDLIDLTRQL